MRRDAGASTFDTPHMNSRARSCDSHIPAHARPISQNIGASTGNRMAGYLKTAALAALFKVPCQFTGDMTFGGDKKDLQNSVTRGVKVRLECSPPLNHVPMEPSVRQRVAVLSEIQSTNHLHARRCSRDSSAWSTDILVDAMGASGRRAISEAQCSPIPLCPQRTLGVASWHSKSSLRWIGGTS